MRTLRIRSGDRLSYQARAPFRMRAATGAPCGRSAIECHLLAAKCGFMMAQREKTQSRDGEGHGLAPSSGPTQIRLRLENSRGASEAVCYANPEQGRDDSNRDDASPPRWRRRKSW